MRGILHSLVIIVVVFLVGISGCVNPTPITNQTSTVQTVLPATTITTVTPVTTAISATTAATVSPTPHDSSPTETGSNTGFSGKYIDVNVHFKPIAMPVEDLIKNMDQQGIETAINIQTPTDIFENHSPHDYGIPNGFKSYPGRILFLYGNPSASLLDSVVTRGSYTESDQQQFTQLLEDAMKSGDYCGFGDIALRHMPQSQSDQADVTIPGDHPWMFIMSDIAAKYDVPIVIHMEASPDGVAKFEKLLYHNNKTKIIWEHAGWQKTESDLPYPDYVTPELWRKLFEQHPNLYTDIKIRPNRQSTDQSLVEIFDTNSHIKPKWMQLIRDYPDRFMMGSDIKPGMNAGEGFENIQAEKNLLQQLPPDIERKFERDNAIKIYKIKTL